MEALFKAVAALFKGSNLRVHSLNKAAFSLNKGFAALNKAASLKFKAATLKFKAALFFKAVYPSQDPAVGVGFSCWFKAAIGLGHCLSFARPLGISWGFPLGWSGASSS